MTFFMLFASFGIVQIINSIRVMLFQLDFYFVIVYFEVLYCDCLYFRQVSCAAGSSELPRGAGREGSRHHRGHDRMQALAESQLLHGHLHYTVGICG